jgi:hypothetical protein
MLNIAHHIIEFLKNIQHNQFVNKYSKIDYLNYDP